MRQAAEYSFGYSENFRERKHFKSSPSLSSKPALISYELPSNMRWFT